MHKSKSERDNIAIIALPDKSKIMPEVLEGKKFTDNHLEMIISKKNWQIKDIKSVKKFPWEIIILK